MVTSSPPANGVRLTPQQAAGLIVANGGRGDGVVIGTAIMLRETGGTLASNTFRPASRNRLGGNDRGVWQWNDKAHPDISDADAYDPVRATAWAARKSAGFTDFGPWDIGPNAYSGRDKLAELQSSEWWPIARTAAANPVSFSPSTSGFAPRSSSAGDLAPWDTNGDGVVDGSDWTAEDSANWDGMMARTADDEQNPKGIRASTLWNNMVTLGVLGNPALLRDPLDPNGANGPLYKDPGGMLRREGPDADQTLTVSEWNTVVKRFLIEKPEAGPPPSLNIPIITPIVETVDGAIDTVQDALGGWADALGRFLNILTSASFWRRILIVLGGVALIALAVVVANRETIASVATKGAVKS